MYGNYEYRYNKKYSFSWWDSAGQNGWGVRCLNDIADPGVILESINGKLITSLSQTFSSCTALTGTITIDVTIKSYDKSKFSMCFSGVDMRNITLTGSAFVDTLNAIGATGHYWTPIQ